MTQHEPTQGELLLDMFRARGGVLRTADFNGTRLYSQYRRALCKDLKKLGFGYESRMVSKNNWEYRLVDLKIKPAIFGYDKGGQRAFA